MATRTVTAEQAETIGREIGIDWAQSPSDVDQCRTGLEIEFEHGSHDPETNVTNSDALLTGKIAWAHRKEFPG